MSAINPILEDIAMFADLGTAAPQAVDAGGSAVIRLIRDGRQVTLSMSADGRVIERIDSVERQHASFRALLASSFWANLGKWADSQRAVLQERAATETIPIVGMLGDGLTQGEISLVDDALEQTESHKPPRTNVILIDGPAGIGKTSLIRALAYRRAASYRVTQRPLILHVESRGRVLQNLTDLMAFSLQTLRLSVTYDQIPVLVKHGLIALAIDGFDELGDPNGYDLAWAQLNDLLVSIRGSGKIILSGRETFIGRERVKKALPALDLSIDRLETFTIQPLRPSVAKNWLSERGWTEDLLESEATQPLFEERSYALRPFFLSELARDGVAQQIVDGDVGDLLSFLITAMLAREASKFGADVEAVTTEDRRMEFIARLMEEVARDLAENQASAIPSDTLSWLAEASADGIVPNSLSGILKNRAGVVAFLKDDDRRGYKNFSHDQIYHYFLSRSTIRSVIDGEIPKYVRRNILGIDFLEAFGDVFRLCSGSEIDSFFSSALSSLKSLGNQDRSRQNLSALILSGCCVASPSDVPVIEDVSIDEAYFTETVSHVHLNRVIISQITANGADLRGVHFDKDCLLVSLVADEKFIPHPSLPLPTVLSLPGSTTYNPEQISDWLRHRFRASMPRARRNLGEALSDFGLFDLLARVARYKPFWLKDGDEKGARRILDDEHWPKLKEILERHDLIVERTDVPASGRPAPFYHVKNRAALMNIEEAAEPMQEFFADVFEASFELEHPEL